MRTTKLFSRVVCLTACRWTCLDHVVAAISTFLSSSWVHPLAFVHVQSASRPTACSSSRRERRTATMARPKAARRQTAIPDQKRGRQKTLREKLLLLATQHTRSSSDSKTAAGSERNKRRKRRCLHAFSSDRSRRQNLAGDRPRSAL
jgi:hypothetical protein